MNWFSQTAKTTLLILMFGALLFSPRASAQAETPTPDPTSTNSPQANETSADGGWHVGITPYLWFAGVHGTAGALGHDASVHASFGDIFNYFNIGAMGAMEVRYNRIVAPVDFMWMKLSDNKALPIEEASLSLKAKMTETLLTAKIGYRFIDEEKFKADVLLGFRYWHLGNSLTLQPTQPLGGFSASANWVDEVAGAKFQYQLTPKVVAAVLGDAGGGDAKLDWQAAGFLGYKISRRWVLLAGYRYLSVDYRPNGQAQFVYNVNMPGVVFGATFNAK